MNTTGNTTMSRLDSFIRRVSAQRDILNFVHSSGMVPDVGPILEFGLGNGRTYSHIRELFPKRCIIALDRAVLSHNSSTPDPENLIIGEIEQTARSFVGMGTAMIHSDIGSGYADKDAQTLTWLPA